MRSGGGCVARIQACVPHPHPPHLEAPALETSEPRQQLQKLGTRSQLSWPVGRGREREGPGRGYLLLSPSPEEGRGGRPQPGRASRVSVELGTAGGGGAEGGAGEGRAAAPPPSHAPPCDVRSSRTSSESCRWGQQDAGGSRGGRPVPPQLGWQGPARCVRLPVRAPPPRPSPCSPGSACGALPWPGGSGPRRAAPDLPGRRPDPRTPGAEGSQVSRSRGGARRGSRTAFRSPPRL